MATTLGKRKRRADLKDLTPSEPTDSASTEHLQALFRKHFEAKYKPLPPLQIVPAPTVSDDPDASDSEDSEWAGLDNEEGQAVPVIEHVAHPKVDPGAVRKSELMTFMVPPPSSFPPHILSLHLLTDISSQTPKPPLPSPPIRPTTKSKPPALTTDATESALATNDLALHRLLTESHLLSSHPSPILPSSTPTLTTNRQKAHDLRLLSLGAKSSLHVQQKMPMNHRKGMEEKKREREEGRRREARENGVVLEREGGKKRGKERGWGKRERGVGDPAVGRWKGGMLVLGRRDVESIQGREGTGRGGRGGKRGRGR